MSRKHSRFVTITTVVAIVWLFEHGYAKEAARYFQTAGNSFRTMLKKPLDLHFYSGGDKRGILPGLLHEHHNTLAGTCKFSEGMQKFFKWFACWQKAPFCFKLPGIIDSASHLMY